MREGFKRTDSDPSKRGLRLGLRPGDKFMINETLEVEYLGNEGHYIRLLFSGEPTKWKITRKPRMHKYAGGSA